MTMIATDLGNTRERARELRFEPTGSITETNVQKAIEQVASQPQGVVQTAVTFGMSPYTVLDSDTFLAVDTSGGAVTINLQAAADRNGVPISIKDVSGDGGTNAISLVPSGAETVDELTPYPIGGAFAGVRLNPQTTGYTVAP